MISITPLVPSKALAAYVDSFLLYESRQAGGRTLQLVPSNMQNIGFILEGAMSYFADGRNVHVPRMYVLGQLSRPLLVNYQQPSSVFCINFKATGMYQLFGISMATFRDMTVDLGHIIEPDERNGIQQIFEPMPLLARKTLAEHFLSDRLACRSFSAEPVQRATDLILRQFGAVSIKRVAREVNVSERNLQRFFLQKVGVSPKTFAGIARIRKALQLIETMPKCRWRDITSFLEYSDRAHFIRDFKKFAGRTPTEYHSLAGDFEHNLYGLFGARS